MTRTRRWCCPRPPPVFTDGGLALTVAIRVVCDGVNMFLRLLRCCLTKLPSGLTKVLSESLSSFCGEGNDAATDVM